MKPIDTSVACAMMYAAAKKIARAECVFETHSSHAQTVKETVMSMQAPVLNLRPLSR